MDYAIQSPISYGKGVYLYTKNKKKYLDSTGGMTGSISLGWDNKFIQNEIIKQLKKIAHIDYKSFKTESQIHDYHNSGMCKKCSEEILLEPNRDLKWLN